MLLLLISEQGLTINDFRSVFDLVTYSIINELLQLPFQRFKTFDRVAACSTMILIQHSFKNQKSLIFIRKSFFSKQ